MKTFIIDRIIDEVAICEDEMKNRMELPRNLLPSETKEGDLIILTDKGNYEIDKTASKERKEEIRSKMNRLFE